MGDSNPGQWFEKRQGPIERENPLSAGGTGIACQPARYDRLQRLFSKAARAAARHSTWGSTHCAGFCHALWNARALNRDISVSRTSWHKGVIVGRNGVFGVFRL